MPSSCKELSKLALCLTSHFQFGAPGSSSLLCNCLTNAQPTPFKGDALAQCLQESECVMVHRNSAADCLRAPLSDTLPPKCLQLKRGFGECKRGLVDMRKRFRGNVPVSYQTIQKADEEGKGYQLYAGKSAFGGGVKYTNGDEQEQDWRDLANEKYRAELSKNDGAPKA
ncbi:hypothetical protein jhhlp_003788 [Lomentospora prolificans]|uniref:Uncharacterized protein n=1 Tax=Lomentospora prolificans TaxID=41688 RepID=A0A2N3N9T3_9PEZI|nr:hypothetical protein jhhlp_003788 [Lomentospora prolificans]